MTELAFSETNRIHAFSLPIPEKVYTSQWAPLTEPVRWRVASELGITPFPFCAREYFGEQPILQTTFENEHRRSHSLNSSPALPTITLSHEDKNLTALPIQTDSLWRELLPYPFCRLNFSQKVTSSAVQFRVEPSPFEVALRYAYEQVLRLEELLLTQELTGLVFNSESSSTTELVVLAFQAVRKKRVRHGILQDSALAWFQQAIQDCDANPEVLPRMHFYQFTCGKLKSEASDSMACPAPAHPESSAPISLQSHPEAP